MGINHAAFVGVGLEYGELIEGDQDWAEFYDWNVIQLVQPYYDAPYKYSYLAVPCFNVEDGTIEIDKERLDEAVQKAYLKFKDETGKDGKLIVSTNSW